MATFLATAQVTVGENTIDRVASVEVTDDWQELGSMAKIELPLLKGRVDKEDTQRSLADQFSEGDPVEVKLRWEGRLQTFGFTEFSGFVKRVSPTVPMVLECEDQLYWARRTQLSKSFGATTLKDLVEYALSEISSQHNETGNLALLGDVPNINFTKFRFNNVNAAHALQELRRKYGLAIYFKPEGLFCGLAYTDNRGGADYNFYGNIIKHNLVWRKKGTGTVRLRATSLLKDNKQLTVEVPDGGSGAVRSRFYAGIESEGQLRQLAEKDLAQLSREGFEGSLTGYITPFVRPGFSANLIDPEYDFRSGSYHVDKVTTTFSPKNGKGIRRKIELGIRLL